MNDTQSLIGKIIEGKQERDAIHIAVAPVTAAFVMQPGQPVRIDNGKAFPDSRGGGVGIVDPFLTGSVAQGETFWLFLYPNTIPALRHDWTHPAFAPQPKGAAMSASEIWLRSRSAEWGISYSQLMEDVAGGVVCFGDDSTPDLASGSEQLLQFHAGVVLGRTVPEPYFRCAC